MVQQLTATGNGEWMERRHGMRNGWMVELCWSGCDDEHTQVHNEPIFTAARRRSLMSCRRVSGVCSWAWEMRACLRPAWEQGRTSRQQQEHTQPHYFNLMMTKKNGWKKVVLSKVLILLFEQWYLALLFSFRLIIPWGEKKAHLWARLSRGFHMLLNSLDTILCANFTFRINKIHPLAEWNFHLRFVLSSHGCVDFSREAFFPKTIHTFNCLLVCMRD